MFSKFLLGKVTVILISDVFIKLFGYVLLPFYLSNMSVLEFGEFGFVFSISSLLAPLVSLGMYVPQIREFTESNQLTIRKQIYSTTLVSTFVICLFMSVIMVAIPQIAQAVEFSLQLSGDRYLKLILFAILLSFTSLNLINLSHSIGLNTGKDLLIFNWSRFLLNSILSVGCLYYFYFSHDSVINRLWALIIGEVILMGISFIRNREYFSLYAVDKVYLRLALISGLQIMPSTLLLFTFSYFERFNLSNLVGKAALANYNLALQMTAPITMVMATVQSVWAPYLYRIGSINESIKKSRLLGVVLLVFFLVLSFAILVLIKFSISFHLIPQAYSQVGGLAMILSFGVSISSLIQIVNNLLIKYEFERFVTYNYFFSIIVFLVFSPFLVRIFGELGMAYSNILYGLFLLLMGCLFVKLKVLSDKKES